MFIGVFEGTEGREEVRVGATWHGDPGGHGWGGTSPGQGARPRLHPAGPGALAWTLGRVGAGRGDPTPPQAACPTGTHVGRQRKGACS